MDILFYILVTDSLDRNSKDYMTILTVLTTSSTFLSLSKQIFFAWDLRTEETVLK